MRFGKKSRNLAAASRRFFGERAQPHEHVPDGAVDTLEPMEDEDIVMTPPPPEDSIIAGDPTQRLLTSLGRFQRQVTRAEEGVPQETWCDECMNQLYAGIEIARDEDWADVKEALTDTARVLYSYEKAHAADQCIYFLKDSYEILCLMVGDLIVGSVRSGVMKKWQDRYERGLDELASAGISLVDDDAPEEDNGHRNMEDGARNDSPEATEDNDIENVPGSVFDEGAEAELSAQAADTNPFGPIEGSEDDTDNIMPFSPPHRVNTASDTDDNLPSLDEMLGRPVTEEDDLDDDGDEDDVLELSEDFTADVDGANMEDTYLVTPGPDMTEEEAPEDTADAPVDATEALQTKPDELDFGDADAEEAPVLQADEPEQMAPEQPEATAEQVPAPEPKPEPEPDVEPEPGTPEALLRTAQKAMAMGNVAEAKVFALQLAANMAKLEADQVQGRLTLIEKDIDTNSDAITAAELAVNEAEERVRQLEEQVAHSQHEFEEKRKHIDGVREEVATVEASVEDLNQQIAALEARRDAEVERLQASQTNLDDSLNEESRLQSEIESLRDEEAASRENLEGAREHVKTLQESGAGHVSLLESTTAELAQRIDSVADIEKTIRQVSGQLAIAAAESGDPEPGAAHEGSEPDASPEAAGD